MFCPAAYIFWSVSSRVPAATERWGKEVGERWGREVGVDSFMKFQLFLYYRLLQLSNWTWNDWNSVCAVWWMNTCTIILIGTLPIVKEWNSLNSSTSRWSGNSEHDVNVYTFLYFPSCFTFPTVSLTFASRLISTALIQSNWHQAKIPAATYFNLWMLMMHGQ